MSVVYCGRLVSGAKGLLLKGVLENKGKQAKDLSGNAVSEAKDKAGK